VAWITQGLQDKLACVKLENAPSLYQFMKRAVISGVTGQDGSYLADFLLAKGYEVHGIVRRASVNNRWRIEGALERGLKLHHGDLSDSLGLVKILGEVQPHEVYNLGAQSHVKVSFETPEYSCDVDATGVIRMLEATRQACPMARFYQASSSELFGKSERPPFSETTPFYPRSPYGCAKALAYYATVNYREAYGMHASNGILFNHESPRRGENFVTRKITQAVARISLGRQEKLFMGNIAACRDWGYAPDFVRAMWMMMQQPTADDYVIATGQTQNIISFLDRAFSRVNLDWTKYVVPDDPRFTRPSDVEFLLGDASKAAKQLGWRPETSFEELVNIMVDADLEREKNQRPSAQAPVATEQQPSQGYRFGPPYNYG
jgi:GDPmannose 4,6-dehydratase